VKRKTVVYIDPPSGWKYGFPKPSPANLRQMNPDEFNQWLIDNGYPREEVDIWRNNPNYLTPPCGFSEYTYVEEED